MGQNFPIALVSPPAANVGGIGGKVEAAGGLIVLLGWWRGGGGEADG